MRVGSTRKALINITVLLRKIITRTQWPKSVFPNYSKTFLKLTIKIQIKKSQLTITIQMRQIRPFWLQVSTWTLKCFLQSIVCGKEIRALKSLAGWRFPERRSNALMCWQTKLRLRLKRASSEIQRREACRCWIIRDSRIFHRQNTPSTKTLKWVRPYLLNQKGLCLSNLNIRLK